MHPNKYSNIKMEDNKLPRFAQDNPRVTPDALDRPDAYAPVSSYAGNSDIYPVDLLEVHEKGQTSGSAATNTSLFKSVPFSRRKATVVSLVITGFIVLATGASSLFILRHDDQGVPSSNLADVSTQDVSLETPIDNTPPKELQGANQTFVVNGDIVTRGELQVVNSGFAAVIRPQNLSADQTFTLPDVSGTLCIDSNNCGYASLAQVEQIENLVGQIVVPVVPEATRLNGQAGSLSLQGAANRISVTTGNGVITITTPQDIATGSSPTFANLLLTSNFSVNGTVTLGVNCSGNLNGGSLTTNGTGQIICSDDDGGGGGGVSTPGGTSGFIPVFTAAQTIANSLISQALGTVSISGSLSVSADISANSLALATDLPVTSGGTGASSFITNGVLLGSGSGAISATAAPGAGQLLLGNVGGVPVFVAMSGDIAITSAGVTTIQPNSVALGVDTTGNYVASLVAGNGISVGAAGEGSTPTIALTALTSDWSQTGAFDIVLNNASSELRVLESSGGIYFGSLDVGDLSADRTYTLPDASGTICLSTGNCAGAGGGVTTVGGTTNQVAKFDGSQSLTDSSITDDGTAVTTGIDLIVQGGSATLGTALQDGALTLYGNGYTATLSTSALTGARTFSLPDGSGEFCIRDLGNCSGSAGGNATASAQYLTLALDAGLSAERTLSFNGTNFSTSDGGANGSYSVNTVQNIDTTAAPTFAGLTLTGNLNLNANTLQGTNVVIDFTNFDVASNGNVVAGTYNGQTISSVSSLTGTLSVAGLTTLNGGLAIETGDTITFNGDAFTDLTGNGLQVSTNVLTLMVQSSKGLEVDGNGLSLIDCVSGEILKYNGSNQWVCATDAGSGGLGDDVSVNGTGASGANFVDTTATGTAAAITWGLNNVSDPDQISLTVGTASATEAGIVTTGAQTFAGNKTFTGLITLNGGLTVEAGDTFTFNSDAFTDLSGTGLQVVAGVLETTLGTSVDLTAEVTGTLPDANVSDTLTIGATSTVDDAALSANVTKLGATITKDELTNSGLLGFTWSDSEVANNLTIDWTGLQNYPTGCNAGEAVTAVGDTLTCAVFAAGSGSGNYIQNQNLAQQSSADYWISGTGRADTAVVTPLLQSTGALTLDAGSNILTIDASDTTIRRTASGTFVFDLADAANTTFAIDNSGAGAANLRVSGLSNCDSIDTDASGNLVCGSDAGGAGVGDDVQVNGTNADSANFVNTTASGTTAGVTWNLNTGTAPDQISLTVGTASATEAGIVTTGAQTFAGNKTFTGLITLNGGLTVEAGDTFTFNSDAFTDLSGTGLQVVAGVLETTLGTSVDLAAEVTGTLPDVNVSDTLTIGATSTVDDAALSANVTKLGATITKDELTNSGLLGFTWSDSEVANNLTIDWTGLQNYPTGCNAGEAVTAVGDTLTCAVFATSDTDTTYTAGNDLDLSGTIFSIESQLDFVSTINRTGADLTLQTSTSGDIILSSAGNIRLGGFNCTTFANGGVLTTDASGNITCADDNGAAGGTITGSGTSGALAVFTGANTIGDSWLAQNVSTLEIANTRNLELLGGNLTVDGTGSFTGAISASNFSGSSSGTNTGDVTLAGQNYLSLAGQVITANQINLGTHVTGTLPDVNVSDTLTIGATSTVDDAALSANVTKLGATITKDELTNSGLLGFTWSDSEVANNLTIDWTGLQNYPTGCNAGEAVTAVGDTLTCAVFAAGSGSGNYIQNQNLAQQSSADYWISGTGRADTAVVTPLLDTATATALNIGSSNATQINLNKNTQISGSLTVTDVGNVAFQRNTTNISTTGTLNDLNLGSGVLFRFTGASTQTLTSIANPVDGRLLTLVNAAAQSLIVRNESGGTNVNRIITGTGGDLTVPAGSTIQLLYDSATVRWRVVGSSATTGGAANQSLSNLSSVAINTSLLTGADNTIDLGSAAFSWRSLYADTSVLTPAVDTAAAGTLSLGATTATAITLGKAGITTINAGALTVTQAFTTDSTAQFNGNVILAASQSLTITGGNTASRPGSPTEGMIYFDTTTKSLLTYSNGKWQADRTTATKTVAPSNASQAIKDSADYVADGTSDQTEINSALTAAAGGKVYLFEGTFTTDDVISIPNNTTLSGAGRGTLIQFANIAGQTKNMITNTDTTTGTGVVIRDVRLDGDKATNTTGTMYGIYLEGMGSQSGSRQGGIVTNTWISNFISDGIRLNTSSYNNITNNTLQANTGNGIYIGNGRSNVVTNNILFGMTGHGIWLSASFFTMVANNNVVSSGSSGIRITSGTDNTITSNNLKDNTASTAHSSIYVNDSDRTHITSNTITDTAGTGYAIEVNDAASDNTYLSDNIYSGTGASSISDAGTNTIYAGQSNGSSYLLTPQDDFAITGNAASTVSTTAGDLTIQAGSGTVSLGSSTNLVSSGALSIRSGGANTLTVDTGGAATLNLGTTNANAVSISRTGITTTVNGALTVTQGLTANSTASLNGNTSVTTTSASAFLVQTAGNVALLTANTSGMQVVVGNSGNTITLSGSGIVLAGTARNAETIRYAAEYQGSVLDAGTMSNNTGTMTSGYDITNRMNYYKWTTTQATNQSYDIVVQVPIPKDFDTWASNPLSITGYTSNTTNGTITLEARDSTDSVICNFVSVTPGSTSTWTANNTACTLSSGTYTAGDYMTLRIRVQSPQNGDVRVGNLTLNYLGKY